MDSNKKSTKTWRRTESREKIPSFNVSNDARRSKFEHSYLLSVGPTGRNSKQSAAHANNFCNLFVVPL